MISAKLSTIKIKKKPPQECLFRHCLGIKTLNLRKKAKRKAEVWDSMYCPEMKECALI